MRFSTIACAAVLAFAATVPALAGAQISFQRTEYNFGEIKKGSNGTVKFVFTNTGYEPLIVSNAKASGKNVTVTWPNEPVMHGAPAAITVTYDTQRVGQFIKSIIVTSSSDEPAPVLQISGTVTPE